MSCKSTMSGTLISSTTDDTEQTVSKPVLTVSKTKRQKKHHASDISDGIIMRGDSKLL